MELRQYLSLIGKWSWLVILSVVIAAGSSFLASRAATPIYQSKTTLMVGRATQNPDPNTADLNTGAQLALTYGQLARRQQVLESTLEKLGLKMSWEQLAGRVTTNIVAQTQLLEIKVADVDPYRAMVLADTIAEQLIQLSPTTPDAISQEQVPFTEAQLNDLKTKIENAQAEIVTLNQELDAANSTRQIQSLEDQIRVLETKIDQWQNTYSQLLLSFQGGDVNALSVVDEASLPNRPISPNVGRNVMLASVLGLILSAGGAILIEYMDDSVKSSDDLARITDLPILGTVTRIEGESYADKLIALRKPLSPVVEAYRLLRTNLQFSSLDEPLRTLLMTSPGPGEGKSVSLANLAVVMAQSGLQVIAVDSDLRKPVLHKIFDLSNRYGLSDAVLNPHNQLSEYLQPTAQENLKVLTSGPIPPNPSEVLGSAVMKDLIEKLKSAADIVLFDCPPVLALADAVILGRNLDGTILVTDSGRTRTSEAKQAIETLRRVHVNLIGTVLNRLPPGLGGYYYAYGYRQESEGITRIMRRKKSPNGKPKDLERALPFHTSVKDPDE